MSPWRRPDGVKDPTYVLGQIRTSLHWLVGFTIVLYLALGGIAIKSYLDANRIHDTLCTVRADFQARRQAAQKFLHDHPNGTAGIPAPTLRQSIAQQQRTIAALSDLGCPGV